MNPELDEVTEGKKTWWHTKTKCESKHLERCYGSIVDTREKHGFTRSMNEKKTICDSKKTFCWTKKKLSVKIEVSQNFFFLIRKLKIINANQNQEIEESLKFIQNQEVKGILSSFRSFHEFIKICKSGIDDFSEQKINYFKKLRIGWIFYKFADDFILFWF